MAPMVIMAQRTNLIQPLLTLALDKLPLMNKPRAEEPLVAAAGILELSYLVDLLPTCRAAAEFCSIQTHDIL